MRGGARSGRVRAPSTPLEKRLTFAANECISYRVE
jgi:hypothetical protein